MRMDQHQAQTLTGSRAVAPAPVNAIRDLRLFAYTFAGGFLFMTIYLG